jgi:hypothetical protein
MLLGLAVAPAVHAQTVPPAAAQPSPRPAPDVVRLKNGGLLRGTIAELEPGATVTIVTVAGESRHFRMDEVAYAGPASADAPRAAPPLVLTPPRFALPEPAVVSFQSDPPGLVFHRVTTGLVGVGMRPLQKTMMYTPLCVAPCTLALPAGWTELALGNPREMPAHPSTVLLPPGNSEVLGHLESRSGMRMAGWVVLIGSVVGGAVLLATSFPSHQECNPAGCVTATDMDVGRVIAGSLVLFGGGAVGYGLASARDTTSVEVK